MEEFINKLIEERARAFESYKEFLDGIRTEERDMSGEEKTKDERYTADLDELDARIADLTEKWERGQVLDAQRAKFEKIVHADPVPAEKAAAEAEADKLRAFLRGETRAYEVNVGGLAVDTNTDSGVYEVRDLTVGTAAAGGNLVPTSFRKQLYEHLIEASAIRQTNATILTTQSGDSLEIPKTTAAGTAAIVGEGTALAEADPAFGKVTLGAWKYGQLIQVSQELIQDNAVNLLGYLARDAGRALGYASGAHFVTGTGTNQPLGIMVAAGTGVTGGTGTVGVFTADNLIDLYYSVNELYGNRGYWFMRRASEGSARKLKDSQNRYLWEPSLQVGSPNMLLGRPIVSDPSVAAEGTSAVSVAFGDFSPYTIRDVAGVRFERSDEFAFDKDLVTFRAVLRTDGDLADLTGAVKTFMGGTA